MIKFLVRYYNNGKWYGTHIYATDWGNADSICKRHNLQLDGEHILTVSGIFGYILNFFIKEDK